MSASVSELVNRHLRSAIGSRTDPEPQRAAVTFLGVESIEVLRFVTDDGMVYATVGCARHPMTDPTDLNPDPMRGPRVELVVRMNADHPLPGLHRQMATVAAAPSVEGLVLGDDALVDLGEPVWEGSSCTAMVLEPDVTDDVELPEPMEPVRFLRAVPITANEAAWVRLKGIDALREAWTEAGIDVASAVRAAASF